MTESGIQKAVRLLGSQAKLAERLGVTKAFVNQIVSGARRVPAERCRPIEEATGGAVTRYELRPDVFGPAPQEAA